MGIEEKAKSWDLELLVSFIVGWHHQYAKDNIPKIIGLIERVNDSTPNQHKKIKLFRSYSKNY